MATKTRSRSSAVKQEELVVGPKGKSHFRSLDVALKRIADGGTIHLLPGRHFFYGKIPVSVKVVGHPEEDKVVELAVPYSHQVEVRGVSLTLYNCYLSCSVPPSDWSASRDGELSKRDYSSGEPFISVTASGSLVIEHCVGSFDAPTIASSDGSVTLRSCLFHRCSEERLLRISGTASAEVDDCEFNSLFKPAIEFAGKRLDVKGCFFSNTYQMVRLKGGNSRFERCVFEKCDEEAMLVEQSADVELMSCQFKENRFGLCIEGSSDVRTTACAFSHNQDGLRLTGAGALCTSTSEFLGNSGRGLYVNTSRTVDLDSCQFDQANSIGILVEDGDLRLLECTWSASSTDTTLGDAEQLGWDDLKEEQEGIPTALRVSGSHAHLHAQGCKWHSSQSVEVRGRATASFLACSFRKVYRPVMIKNACAIFRACTWSEANFVSLRVSGASEVDVSEGLFFLCPVAIYSGDDSQVRVTSTTARELQNAAFVTTNQAQATYQKCLVQEIGRVAVEAYGNSKISLLECNFSSSQMALQGWQEATMAAERCDFRLLFAPPEGKKTPKKKKASSSKRRVWDMTLLPDANNSIGEHIKFKNCRFPPFEPIA